METSRHESARDQAMRTWTSESDRPKLGKSTKSGDGRSSRGAPSNQGQKKLGTRITDLESQLGLAQEELKCLKDHLASTDTGRKTAQTQVEKKPKKQQKVSEAFEIEEKHTTPIATNRKVSKEDESIGHNVEHEIDVFKVSIEKVAEEEQPKAEVDISTELAIVLEPESNPLRHELALKEDEINLLKANLSDKDSQVEAIRRENESLRSELDEKLVEMSSTQSEMEKLTLRLTKVMEELEESKSNVARMNDKLEAADKAKEELEKEMMKLRVQTEQWRKAADAAASVLARGVEMNNGHKCGLMDTTNLYEPGMNDDCEYGLGGSEKRRGGGGSGGIRILGDLWKKMGQK